MAALLVAVITIGNLVPLSSNQATATEIARSLVHTHPLGRLFEFTLGMAAAELWRRTKATHLNRIWATMAEVGILLLFIASMRYTSFLAYNAGRIAWIGDAGREWLVHGGIACVPSALLIFIVSFERGLISQMLALPFFVILGEISYSMYLLHQPLIRYAHTNARAFAFMHNFIFLPLFFLFILLASYVVWMLVERPARTVLLGFLPVKGQERKSTMIQRLRAAFTHSSFFLRRDWTPLAAPCALLLCSLTACYVIKFRPTIHIASPGEAQPLVEQTPVHLRAISFGGRFSLIGFTWSQLETSEPKLHLLWKSLKTQRLDFLNALHLVDTKGTILSNIGYIQDPSKALVTEGTVWHDVVEVPVKKLNGATHLAIGLLNGNDWLLTEHQPNDWGGRRIVIPLPMSLANASPAPAMRSTEGFLEVVNSEAIIGWVWDRATAEKRLCVDIFDGSVPLMTLSATNFRPDLVQGKIGDGCYSFRTATPASLRDGRAHQIHVRVSGEQFELRNSPKTLIVR